MTKDLHLEHSDEFFEASFIETVAVLAFKEKFLLHISDLTAKDHVLNFLEHVSQKKAVKILVIQGAAHKTGTREYLDFFQQAVSSTQDHNTIHRFYNAIDQLILSLVDLNKLIVHVDSGPVISLFLNISLACDYRIVADNTVFENPYFEIGLIPKGGGSFLLPRLVGFRQAYQVLLARTPITAQEAHKIGIVDLIVPAEDLRKAALSAARRLSQRPASSLAGIKRLMNHDREKLRDCLKLENKEICRILDSADFIRPDKAPRPQA